jgi:hypothetical protein
MMRLFVIRPAVGPIGIHRRVRGGSWGRAAHCRVMWVRCRALCLLKSPFSLRRLKLRPTMHTLRAKSVLLSLLLTLRTWARSRAVLQLEI